MSKLLIIGLVAVSIVLPAIATTSHAQPVQLRQAQETDQARSDLKAAIVRVTGAGTDTVEIVTTASVIAVKLVNGNMNDATTVDRENYAAGIVATVSKEIPGKAEFKGISSLRVEFVTRKGTASKVVDAIEFREDASGAFIHHKT